MQYSQIDAQNPQRRRAISTSSSSVPSNPLRTAADETCVKHWVCLLILDGLIRSQRNTTAPLTALLPSTLVLVSKESYLAFRASLSACRTAASCARHARSKSPCRLPKNASFF